MENIRELAIELEKNVPAYSGICLPAFFDDNVTDAIFKNTKGSEDNLNIDTFASTMAELIEWKAKEGEENTKNTQKKLDSAPQTLDEQTDDIIKGAVDHFKNKLGWRGIFLWISQQWSIVVAVIFTGVAAGISAKIGNWNFMWVIIIPIVISALEHFSSSICVVKKIMKRVLPKIEKSYKRKIEKMLRTAELNYKDKILEKTLSETKMISKCRGIIGEQN